MLTKMPMELIEETCENFINKLWELEKEKTINFATSLDCFRDDLRNFFIRELYANSIIKLEKE